MPTGISKRCREASESPDDESSESILAPRNPGSALGAHQFREGSGMAGIERGSGFPTGQRYEGSENVIVKARVIATKEDTRSWSTCGSADSTQWSFGAGWLENAESIRILKGEV